MTKPLDYLVALGSTAVAVGSIAIAYRICQAAGTDIETFRAFNDFRALARSGIECTGVALTLTSGYYIFGTGIERLANRRKN